MVVRIVGLAVGGQLRLVPTTADQGEETSSLNPVIHPQTGQLEDGRGDVHAPDLFPDHLALPGRAGSFDDERNPHGGVIEEHAVTRLAVLPQTLSVIAGEDEKRPIVEPMPFQIPDQVADQRVDVGHLAIVGASPVTAPEGLGSTIRGMGIEEVDPGKESTVILGRHPLQRPAHHFPAPPLGRTLFRKIPIEVESLIQTGAGIEDRGADEGGRPISLGPEPLGQRQMLRLQAESGLVPDSRMVGKRSGQKGAVGRERERRLGDDLLEQDAVLSQGVDRRIRRPCVAVGFEPVGPERVHRDQNDSRRSGGTTLSG